MGIPLFPGSVSEWNPLQVELASNCQYYYNIRYELDERPDEETINDNYLLSQWVQKRQYDNMVAQRKAKLEANKSRAGKAGNLNSESFVFEFGGK